MQWFHSCETQMLKYNRNLVKNSGLVVEMCGFAFTNEYTTLNGISLKISSGFTLTHVDT